MGIGVPPRLPFGLSVYLDRRVLAIFFFGFSSGLPSLLVGPTLSTWLRESRVSLTDIGFVSLVTLTYALKFLWSPLLDHCPIPFLTRRLGLRRSWLLTTQVLLTLSLSFFGELSLTHEKGLEATFLWALGTAFLSATQDIAVDAYRTEVLRGPLLGAGAAAVQFGYRLGMLTSGAGCLLIADHFGWREAYQTMALMMSVGVVATLVSPEPERALRGEKTFMGGPWRGLFGRFLETVLEPFRDFASRPGWLAILAFIGLYRCGETLLGVMANPFYIDLGFSKSEIGAVSKVFGLFMTLTGTAIGGLLVARLGIMRSLLIGGVLQAASNLTFVALALVGRSLWAFAATIAIENVANGLGSAVFIAYLSSLCNVAFTATQYALLSSLAAFVGRFLGAAGGAVADYVSWPFYFTLTTVAAIPGLLALLWLLRRYPPGPSGQGLKDYS